MIVVECIISVNVSFLKLRLGTYIYHLNTYAHGLYHKMSHIFVCFKQLYYSNRLEVIKSMNTAAQNVITINTITVDYLHD